MFSFQSIPKYSFNYAVSDPHTGDNKAQTEYREGGVVKGSYSVSEPDGTLRVVDYSADPIRGFNADVKRLGHAGHPGAVIAAAPIAHLAPIAPIAPIAYAKPLTWAPAYSAINVATGHLGFGLPYTGALWHH